MIQLKLHDTAEITLFIYLLPAKSKYVQFLLHKLFVLTLLEQKPAQNNYLKRKCNFRVNLQMYVDFLAGLIIHRLDGSSLSYFLFICF